MTERVITVPVLSIWRKGLPVTKGNNSQASNFGRYVMPYEPDPTKVVVDVSKKSNKTVLVTWPLKETQAEN